ncbi:MAG: hypothetical protein LKI76_05485 [Megasphaera sp.]|nr:hypothetical protein [Megasphaera sp.]MCI1823369.1 hypothetical protein [Megasphaera sp.]
MKKAIMISSWSKKIIQCSICMENLWTLSDQAVIERLTAIKGIGLWTA